MKFVISRNKKVMGGVPVIHGTRIPISSIINLLSRGKSIEEITTIYYPVLKTDVVKKALREHAEEIKYH
ncbi:DUF433 domain-containing protein [Candidatus Peregrinibacteria bacterium]|nr:DUF433 domain-containing protein [Candidatus Peregrinibacteria bacterium]